MGLNKNEQGIKIGFQKQLFIDDHIVEDRVYVAKELHQAKKYEGNPILEADRPWELGTVGGWIESLFIEYDDFEKIYKMWYMAAPTSENNTKYIEGREVEKIDTDYSQRHLRHGPTYADQWPELADIQPENSALDKHCCMAVSKDLINWEKPSLGVVEYKGSYDNNICKQDYDRHGTLMVFKDSTETDPQKRFKGIIQDWERACYVPEYSPDGIHWTADFENPFTPNSGIRDDAHPPYYDPQLEKYVWIRRVWDKGTGEFGGKRVVAVARSDDFHQWSPVEHIIMKADEIDDAFARNLGCHHAELYGMDGYWPYEGIWLGFVHPYYALREEPRPGEGWVGPIDMQLAFSRDGFYWSRAFDRTPLIPRGEIGEWDYGMVYREARPHIVGDEIWIHYNGWRDLHGPPFLDKGETGAIGLAKLRLDGFVSLNGFEHGGLLTTIPILFEGTNLEINADASKGWIAVEFLENGNPVAGFTKDDCDVMDKDSVSHILSWKGNRDFAGLNGRTIQLRFYLKAADLYSFRFKQ